ncbi:hypothetical protein ANCDUO_08056 [Ancylostoma duodenale]|uniref:Uncharacterized protein n=1 Tax=Ancylostoma duodenale TaxID=51022 RepID=A0A0C2CXD3_9BILA|nr:hypothetical protein ANCDUO_08056 [Ancylostoma duodenale]
MVYHTGLQATVELHIVMDENLPLKEKDRAMQKMSYAPWVAHYTLRPETYQ